mmetsp:Transcript_17168/g.19909  ORF Transcript_17168/g.19909 Transcript_17168/m.19909 type:complete len:80 (-) Transcript_17168:95-334(-)
MTSIPLTQIDGDIRETGATVKTDSDVETFGVIHGILGQIADLTVNAMGEPELVGAVEGLLYRELFDIENGYIRSWEYVG